MDDVDYDPELFFQQQTEELEDKFIEHLSEKYGMNPYMVGEALKDCIVQTKKKFPDYDVYSIILQLFDIELEEKEAIKEMQDEINRVKAIVSKTITSKTTPPKKVVRLDTKYSNLASPKTLSCQHKILPSKSISPKVARDSAEHVHPSKSKDSAQTVSPGCLPPKLVQIHSTPSKVSPREEYVMFEGEKVPLDFPDAELMNSDPDAYIKGMSTAKLERLVKLASYLHYNYGRGGITDNTFDAFEYNLNKKLNLKGRRYEKIGAEPVDKIRTKLTYFMPSLEKVKPGTSQLNKFLLPAQKIPRYIVWSEKLDGVSASVIYRNGVPTVLNTRGDGVIGGDVSYLINKLPSIPLLKGVAGSVAVRGELIILKEEWARMNQSKTRLLYNNPRSFVSANVNSGTLKESAIKHITFVAYEILDDGDGNVYKPSDAFLWLKQNNFLVPSWGIFDDATTFVIINQYKLAREVSAYNIDGLVLAYDQALPSDRNGIPSKVAFKMLLESQIRDTKIINVEWNISRYGRFVPVAIYESVYVDNVRLHRASAFNAAKVRDWNLGKGTVVKVARSGDVIPIIVDVDVNPFVTPIYPPLTDENSYHWKGHDIVLDDIDGNMHVQIKILEHFFSTIGVPGFGEATAKKFWESGFTTVLSVTQSTIKDMKKLKGFGDKKSLTLFENIHNTMRKTRLDRYIPASSVFESGIAKKTIRKVLNAFPGIVNKTESEIMEAFKHKKVTGIGKITMAKIASGIPKFRKFLYSLNEEDAMCAIKEDERRINSLLEKGSDPRIFGKKFVITGFFGNFDEDVEDYIYDNRGEIVDAVTDKVDVVISASFNFSLKVQKSMEEGIRVLTLDEFKEFYITDRSDGIECVKIQASDVNKGGVEPGKKLSTEVCKTIPKSSKEVKITTSSLPSKTSKLSTKKANITPAKSIAKVTPKSSTKVDKTSPKSIAKVTPKSSAKVGATSPKSIAKVTPKSSAKVGATSPKLIAKVTPKSTAKVGKTSSKSVAPAKVNKGSSSKSKESSTHKTFLINEIKRNYEDLVREIKIHNGPLPSRLASLFIVTRLMKDDFHRSIRENKYFRKGLITKAEEVYSYPGIQNILSDLDKISLTSNDSEHLFFTKEGSAFNPKVHDAYNTHSEVIRYTVIPGVAKGGKIIQKEVIF